MDKTMGLPHEDIPRCGAKTRSGGCCGHYSMKNGRCRYHGGKSTGARSPRVKHGYYTKSAIKDREWLRELLKDVDDLLDEMVD